LISLLLYNFIVFNPCDNYSVNIQ